MHRDHALAALEAGAHVLCEKPFCWDSEKELDEILEDGRAIVARARDVGPSAWGIRTVSGGHSALQGRSTRGSAGRGTT